MARALDRDKLLDAFDEIGRAAVQANTRLTIAVFGASALMLASNFRFSTEDVDIAEIGKPWPDWLVDAVERIAAKHNWSREWLSDAVTFHLSPVAKTERDLAGLGSFPRREERVGLTVQIPSDMEDVANRLRVLHIEEVEPAIGVLAEYFPKSAADADKQRFVLKRILSQPRSPDAPR